MKNLLYANNKFRSKIIFRSTSMNIIIMLIFIITIICNVELIQIEKHARRIQIFIHFSNQKYM